MTEMIGPHGVVRSRCFWCGEDAAADHDLTACRKRAEAELEATTRETIRRAIEPYWPGRAASLGGVTDEVLAHLKERRLLRLTAPAASDRLREVRRTGAAPGGRLA
jgi:hypothetical protein